MKTVGKNDSSKPDSSKTNKVDRRRYNIGRASGVMQTSEMVEIAEQLMVRTARSGKRGINDKT